MNYRKSLKIESPIAPEGGAQVFAIPALWVAVAFAIIAFAAFAGSYTIGG